MYVLDVEAVAVRPANTPTKTLSSPVANAAPAQAPKRTLAAPPAAVHLPAL